MKDVRARLTLFNEILKPGRVMSMLRLKIVSDYLNNNFERYSLVDLGCRTRALFPLLEACDHYMGTDLEVGDNVTSCNLEKNLPFDDKSYDIVCALDVLEHLENVHSAFNEIKRIGKKAAIISLPNVAHWTFRLRFLAKGCLSGKYTFHDAPVVDRHRWVTNYIESKKFIENNLDGYKVQFIDIVPARGRTKIISQPIEAWLAKKYPNVFVYGLIAVIDLTKENK
jgi:SAM-dependent methyltransferase